MRSEHLFCLQMTLNMVLCSLEDTNDRYFVNL